MSPLYTPGQPVEHLRTTQSAIAETSLITVQADDGAQEVAVITIPATAGATQADYFTFENQAGDDFAVWFDIDANGTTPTGAEFVAATTKIEVDIVAAATAIDNAALAVTAIGSAFTDVTVLNNADGTITFTQDLLGTTVNPVPLAEDDLSAGSVGVSVSTAGAASSRQDTFLLLKEKSGTIFHVWMNVNSQGSDPAPGGSTALAVALSTAGSASANATAMASAIDSNGNFGASASGAVVRVLDAETGAAVDITAGDSGFTVSVLHQGQAALQTPGSSTTALNNTPSEITALS